jgi:hypothetical protein
MPQAMVRVVRVMPHLLKHPKTSVFYYRRVVPLNLRPALGRTEIRVSLGTKDRREAMRRLPEKAVAVESKFATARQGPVSLTHQQIVALAGAWYERELARREANPGLAEELEPEFDQLELARDTGNRRKAARADAAELLMQQGLFVDDETTRELEAQLFDLKVRLVLTLLQRAEGDYTPDPLLHRLPQWDAVRTKPGAVKGQLTLDGLIDAWAAERRPAQRTRYEWERAASRLASHVGHNDPTKPVPEQIVSWKEALLAAGKSPKTVKNHLFAVHALFGWAVRNRRMAANPATGIEVAAKEKAGARRRLPFSEEDAALLLRLASAEKGARRWVPWLLAFTGARLEEVCQSLVPDIREDRGVWYLDINADHETKSLKNAGSARKVPLHPALIEVGFLDYIRTLPADGPLFPDLSPDRFGRRGGNGTKIIGRWVRASGITDPRKAGSRTCAEVLGLKRQCMMR